MTHDPETIKNALRACDTLERVDATAKLFGGVVADMRVDPVQFVFAIHIRELAKWKRWCIRNPKVTA